MPYHILKNGRTYLSDLGLSKILRLSFIRKISKIHMSILKLWRQLYEKKIQNSKYSKILDSLAGGIII